MSSDPVSLLPGIDSEISLAQRDTIWSASSGSRLEGSELESAYIFIPSFAEVKRQNQPRQTPPRPSRPQQSSSPSQRSSGRQSRSNIQQNAPAAPANGNGTHPEPQFLVSLPPPVVIKEGDTEPWTLHCVCNEKADIGLLVCCEKCQCWQHAICVGLNLRTLPENYICEKCGKRPIRCKCGNNLNYRFALIKCSQCGYYVHRRCVGLHYGPMPKGDFVCNYCGKSKFSYPKTKLPHSIKFEEDKTYTFTQEKVNNLPAHFFNGPFNGFLSIDVAEATLSARDFCESIYDRFRSFFFICHPLNPNVISKKKRHSLFVSFLDGMEQLCKLLYNFNHQQFITIFDALIYADLYKPYKVPKLKRPDTKVEMSENTRIELAPASNSVIKLTSLPPPAPFEITNDGLIAKIELRQDQFITSLNGFIGDLEEFNYDSGVNSTFFQIADTRFILDTSNVENSPLHHIKRSIEGNCIIKIIMVGETTYCGLYAGRATLSSIRSEDVIIKPGEQILFGIDFMPAVLEDVNKWIGWHCPDLDDHSSNRPTRDERDLHAAIRQIEGRRPKTQRPTKKSETKKTSRANKLKKKNLQTSNELSLFDLFESEGPSKYLFTVTDNVEEYQRRLAEAAASPKVVGAKRTKVETTKHSSHRSASQSIPHSRNTPSPRKNDDLYNNQTQNLYHAQMANMISQQGIANTQPNNTRSAKINHSSSNLSGSISNTSSNISTNISAIQSGNVSSNISGNISASASSGLIGSEEKREPYIKKQNELLQFKPSFMKQINQAESAQRYSMISLGDPVGSMLSILQGK